MQKQVGDSSQLLGSTKALREFLAHQDDVSIVGFFNSNQDPLYTTYLDAGKSIKVCWEDVGHIYFRPDNYLI